VEHLRALAVLVERPVPEHRRIAATLGIDEHATPSDYSDLFLFQLYPYASVYLGAQGMLGGDARDRIAGFWRVLGLVPPSEPDHLAVMLALHARLIELEHAAVGEARTRWRRVRHAHLWEHLMSWLPPWLAALDEIAPAPYRSWGRLLDAALAQEAVAIGPAGGLPRHLAEAPPVIDPREQGLDPFLSSLLAPARSGMILTRADLAGAAADLGLSLRAGERRYALRALLAQDTPATLGWLRSKCEAWRERLAPMRAIGGMVIDHWIERAGRIAELLGTLELDSTEALHATGPGDESHSQR